MTAVQRQSTPLQFMGDRLADSPSARFTAVNGKDSSGGPPSGMNGTGILPRRNSTDKPNGHPRVLPPASKEFAAATTQPIRDEPFHPSKHTNHVIYPNGSPEERGDNGQDGAHKRKRSGSSQDSNEGSHHRRGSSGLHTGTEARMSSIEETRAPSTMAAPYSHARPPFETQAPSTPATYSDEARDHARATYYAQQAQEQAQAQAQAKAAQVTTDEQLQDALARETRSMSSPFEGSPENDNDNDNDEDSFPGGVDNRTAAQIQHDDRKKRKRNFSNRTKTGCMTCRRRKKKCDESRPECNNCIRGGFVCSGYPSRGPWPKTEQKPTPIALQAKDGYDPLPPPYNHPSYRQPQPGETRRELPAYRGQQPPPRVDTTQPPRPYSYDDERHSASTMNSTNSPDTRNSATSYNQNTAFPTPVSAHPHHYDRYGPGPGPKPMPPMHEPPRPSHDPTTPQSAQRPLPHINILNPPHTENPHPLSQSTSAQDAARLALSHPAASARPRTQKEQMLMGTHYFPFDRELVLERERCSASCSRFNNSISTGVSHEERARMFRDILQPRDHINIAPTDKSPVSPSGRVGNNVVVEVPFTCDYGYNIHIGQDVAIGKNCTIMDTCEVKIGDRCILGPNVSIFTATLPVDPKRRLGSRGPHLGKSIVIEEDCWIGGGVMILPGRTIKKGSTIGAGSVVTRDVPEFTVVCGNPARVIRGLYPSTHD